MKATLIRLLNNERLTSDESKEILLNITQQKYNDIQIAAMLTIMQMRGISVDELIGFREGLIELSIPVDFAPYKPIDIVGTGGDGKNTFNISTCACFVVAGAGYKVAKHGNYGATSVSGGSNVIEQHGVKLSNDPDKLRRSIEEANIAYLHAQLFHPAMKYVGPIRKALQIPTIFNLLGPIINPSKPAYQLLGVANLNQMRLYASVCDKVGINYSIVNSIDGYDEISLTGEFKIASTSGEFLYHPEDFGFKPSKAEELYGGNSPEEAAKVFDRVLENNATESQKQTVLINAAFAIRTITGKDIEECLAIARESLESGRALQSLKKYIDINA